MSGAAPLYCMIQDRIFQSDFDRLEDSGLWDFGKDDIDNSL